MFGIDLFAAGLMPSILVALFAGMISFLSPCVLPVVPPYLAYMSGISVGEMRQGRAPIMAALFFVMGLSTVFLLLGAAASAFGAFFLGNSHLFAQIAGGVVILFGLHFLNIFRLPFLERDLRLDAGDSGGSAFGAYILGLAFAFGWTPCIGPILGTILTLAAQENSVARGTLLLGVYALGLGLPFLLVAVFFRALTPVMSFFKTHAGKIEKSMGLLLLAVGVMMLTGGFTAMSFWLLETFPFLAAIG
jgi:cytochrome c-type biogenesis protein